MKRGGSLYISSLLLLAALFATAGCARPRNDAQIAGETQGKLYADPSLHGRQITIQSSNGVLTLNGFVSSDPERLAAAADAATIAGVKTVVNNLRVMPSQQMQVTTTPSETGVEKPLLPSSAPANKAGLQPVPSAPQRRPALSTVPPQQQEMATRRKTQQSTQRVLVLAKKTEKRALPAAKQMEAKAGSSLPYSVAASQVAPPSSPVGAAQPPPPGMPASNPSQMASSAPQAPARASSPLPKPIAITASAAPASITPPASTAAPESLTAPQPVTVPAGTSITVRLLDAVDSGRNHPGDSFRATLDAPLLDAAGGTVVPAGYSVTGKIVDVKSAGRFAGSSSLALELTQLSVSGRQYDLQTNPYTRRGKSRGKSTAEKVGGGAALGAILGGIFGGAKGAAIGATMGAGAGTGVSATGRGEQIVLRPETALSFELRSPISVIPTAQPPHGDRFKAENSTSTTGPSSPGASSSTGDEGPPVLKRRGH